MSINQILLLKDKILKKSILRENILWSMIGSGISRIILVIGTIVVANLLGKEDYGKFGLLRNGLNLMVTVIGFTFANTCTKFISEFKESNPRKLERVVNLSIIIALGLSTIVSLSIFFIPQSIIDSFFNETISSTLKVIFLFLPIVMFGTLIEGIYRGFEWFKKLSHIQIVAASTFLILLIVLSISFGLLGALTALISYYTCSAIIGGYNVKKRVEKRNLNFITPNKPLKELPLIQNFSSPIILAGLIEAPIFLLAQFLIVKKSGFDDMGSITAITQIRNLIILLPGYVISAILPRMSSLAGMNNFEGYKKILNRTLIANLTFSIICILPFAFFSSHILGLFGNDFMHDKLSLWISLAFLPFFILSNVLAQDLLAKGYSKENLIISIIWNSCFIFLLIYLLQILKSGSSAFFISQGFGIVVMFVLRYYYSRKFKNLKKIL